MRSDARILEIASGGAHVLSLYDAGGRLRLRRSGTGRHAYALADLRAQAGLEPGLYMARLETAEGVTERALPML